MKELKTSWTHQCNTHSTDRTTRSHRHVERGQILAMRLASDQFTMTHHADNEQSEPVTLPYATSDGHQNNQTTQNRGQGHQTNDSLAPVHRGSKKRS